MQPVTLDDWQRWQRQGYGLLPVAAQVAEAELPLSLGAFGAGPVAAWLESALAGRYTYICVEPARVIVGDTARAEVRSGDFAQVLSTTGGAPLEVLSAYLASRRAPPLPSDWPAMSGGLIGLFGYDLAHTWENLPCVACRDLPLPLYAAIEPASLLVCDQVERTLTAIVWSDLSAGQGSLAGRFAAAARRADDLLARTAAPLQPEAAAGAVAPAAGMAPPPSFSAEGFEAAARRIHEYIAAGDTYQVNLSLRTSRATSAAPTEIYRALRRINPSPYMGFFRLPSFALVCGSPELLVKLVDGRVSSRPIAGTRPRGAGEPQDTRYSAELLASPKERAEHLMLVDLIRNDIGRVAEYGSVTVDEFMVLERYSHVMHIVSQVEGRLASGRTWADVFRAMFPGGTITGCPKIRTMEIVEELEPVGRGYYTGALGWIGYNGAMELNIVIRSMLLQDGIAHVQAGAGVVADSQPERELDESLRKAQALWTALAAAEAAHRHV